MSKSVNIPENSQTMNVYRTLYQLAEIIRQDVAARLMDRSDLRVELGTPRDLGESNSVAVIFRNADGTRAPIEIVVYQEGIAIGEVVEELAAPARHFIGRLRPHDDAERVATRVCDRLRPRAEIEHLPGATAYRF